ncbi:hypothetical protein LPJ66_009836, partial [Kickxella alabastrina]
MTTSISGGGSGGHADDWDRKYKVSGDPVFRASIGELQALGTQWSGHSSAPNEFSDLAIGAQPDIAAKINPQLGARRSL